MAPPRKKKKQEHLQKLPQKSFLELTDNCLEEIFSYFSIQEMVELDKVCPRFRNIAEQFYKKERSLSIRLEDHSEKAVKDLAQRVGRYVSSLEVSGYDLNNFCRNYREYSYEDYLKPLWRHCTNLEHLSIQFSDELTHHVKSLKKIFKNLKSIEFIYFERPDEIVDCFKVASKLETLSFECNRFTNGSFLPCMKHRLKRLKLSECQYIFENSYFTEFCKDNHTLESLEFDFTYKDYTTGDEVDTDVMENLNELKNLRSLKIVEEEDNEIDSSRTIPYLPKLTRLEINPQSSISGSKYNGFLNRLGDIDSLEYLCIYVTSGLKYKRILPKFTKLKVFKIDNYDFKNCHLSSFNNDCRRSIEHLQISGSYITDAALLKFVKDCSNLKSLNITNRDINKPLLFSLMTIFKVRPHAVEIFVSRTKNTKNIAEELKGLHIPERIKLTLRI